MATILVDAATATAGGGANYLCRLIPGLRAWGASHRWIVRTPPDGEPLDADGDVMVRPATPASGLLSRFRRDQVELRRQVRKERIDLILATGNFGLLSPPVPQILWNRNALYFSSEHLRRLFAMRQGREIARTLLGRRLAVASMRASELNLTPTSAFRDEILHRTADLEADRFRVLPFGVDRKEMTAGDSPDHEDRFGFFQRPRVRRILLVSHYNPYRNFETLLRAAAVLRSRPNPPFEIVLTTRLGPGAQDHRYDTSAAYRLAKRLGVVSTLVMLGPVDRADLPTLYKSCDLVVCPSYAESFGHPMVEAMAAGRPIVASDRPEHREICGDAAVYFSTFNAADLARQMEQVLENRVLSRRLSEAGRSRSARFCWNRHFESLVEIVDSVLFKRGSGEKSWTSSEAIVAGCR